MPRTANAHKNAKVRRPPSTKTRGSMALNTLDITVLAGGPSEERAVSLDSGRAVCAALKRLGHRATMMDIVPEDLAALDSPCDCVFVALHGTFGEDGQVQRLLEGRGICYCGAGPAASALSMDKAAAKERFTEAGIPTPRFEVVTAETLDRAVDAWKAPIVIKPVRSGSSVDTYIVHPPSGITEELSTVIDRHGDALIEEFIEGLELTVGILGDRALPPLEIRPKRAFYDYQAKYVDDDTEYIFDIDLPQQVLEDISRQSLRAHRLLEVRDFCRVDWMVDRHTRKPYLLEINTIPGFTSHSLLPKAAARAGISFDELCQRIVTLTMHRSEPGIDRRAP
ncbi:MAG: D-alanine--D-alanine ligase [bacterium]|nr:D-alanine--D-alanine ligase [bacterium]